MASSKPGYEDLEKRIIELEKIIETKKQEQLNNKSIITKELEMNNLFQAIMAQTTEGVSVADFEGNYLFVNPAFCKMSGYTQDELLKMKVFELKAPEQPENIFKDCQNELQNMPVKVLLKRKDNTEFLTEIIGNIIETNENKYVLGTVRDISDRKRTELIIQHKNNKLKELNATKDKFFSIIAHDLKNPFSIIIGFAEHIVSNIEKEKKEKIKELAGHIYTSAHRISSLLNNLLTWSSSQSGSMPFQPKQISLKQFFEQIITFHQDLADNKEIRLKYTIADDLYLKADQNMLNSIIGNLINNAIKYTSKDGQIELKAWEDEQGVIITVSDNGTGIEPEVMKQLFILGADNIRTGTASEKGSGLGLILCKEFVEKHKGTISVNSELNQGSKFTLTFPPK